MKFYYFILFGFLAATACSTASVRVMPGEDGFNTVIVRDIKESAEEEAVKAANKYCAKKDQEAIFTENKTKYTGTMDEGTRDTIRKASTAAMILGGGGAAASHDTVVPGAILGTGGTVGYSMTSGKDYESIVKFKCR